MAFDIILLDSLLFPLIIFSISSLEIPNSFAASDGLRFISFNIPSKLLPILLFSRDSLNSFVKVFSSVIVAVILVGFISFTYFLFY